MVVATITCNYENKPFYYPKKPPINLRDNTFKGAGGCCIWTKTDKKIHVLLGKERTNEWCFAMGKREAGESLVDTAVRETEEEMHVKVTDIKTSPWCIYMQKDGQVLKNVILIYFVELPSYIPASEFQKRIPLDNKYLSMNDYKWVPLDAILDGSAYDGLKVRRCAKTIFMIAKKRGIFNRLK